MTDINNRITLTAENDTNSLTDLFGEVIYSYTRAQAIADGMLVDVSKTAKEAGFRWPVALTHAAWEECVAWDDKDSKRQTYQDQSGRLWDVVWMAFVAIRVAPAGGSELCFKLNRVPRGGRATRARLTTLKLVCGPGDDGDPVITIMLPTED